MQAKILEARIAWNNFTGDAEEAQLLTAELEAINQEIDNTREAISEAAEEVAEPFVAAANLIAEVVTDIVEESQADIEASNASIDAANRFADLQNQLIVQNAELTKELESRKKFISDTIRGLEIENIENEKEAAPAALALAEQTLLAELDAVRATEEQKQLVREEFAKKRDNLNKTSSEDAIKLAKEEAEKRQMIADKAFSVLSDLATLFSKTDEANAEKNFKTQKAIGIAQAAINTGLAVTAALTAGGNPIKLATGAQFVEAGIAAVAGAAQIAAIARTKFQGGGGTAPAPSQPSAPSYNPQAAIDAQNSELADLQNQLIVQNAQLTKELESQKKISEDTTRTFEERKAALDLVNAANEQLAQNALIEAKALENKIALQLQIASNDEDRRALEAELAAATAERIAREQEAEIVRLESAQLNRELDQEEPERKKFISDTIRGLEIENIENEKEAELAALALAEQTLLAELDAVRATEEQKQLVREEFAKKRDNLNKTSSEDAIKLAKEEAEKRQMIADKAFSVLSDLATLFSKTDEANAEKNFKTQKAIGIAQAAINTGLAVTAALTAGGNPIKLATGAQFVEAGIAAVAGAAQIAAIARTKFQGGGGTAPAPSQPSAPSYNPQAAIDAQNSELAGLQDPGGSITPGGQNQPPIRAYVVATEVTSAQEANAQIDNLATL